MPTKGKALWLGILFSAATVALLLNDFNPYLFVFAVPAVLFFSIWFYKYQRDQSIIAKGKEERQRAAQAPLPKPPITSPGSKGIFLPAPLTNTIPLQEKPDHSRTTKAS